MSKPHIMNDISQITSFRSWRANYLRSVIGTNLLVGSLLTVGCNQSTIPVTTLPPATTFGTKMQTPAVPIHDGSCVTTSAILGGSPFPKEVTDSISLQLSGDEYLVMVGDKPDKGTCSVDLTQTPAQMKITGTEGPNAGKTILAIMDRPTGDELRVCYDLTGKAFPTQFESTKENGQFFVVYSRKK